jgi:peptide/nickel transport system substrate-binding protein
MYQSKRSISTILISLALVILTACGPAAPAAAPTEAPASAENTLTFDSNLNDMLSLDPAVTYEFGGILTVHNVYQTLVQFVGSDLTTVKPSLADSWETKDAGDHWEMTFKLHPGNKFASGNPITVDDVVYSFNRVIPINGPPSFLFSAVGGLTPDSVKAVDSETVQINLPKTASPAAFLSVLTNSIGGIVDSKVVKTHETGGDFGSGWLLDHSAGSGPYVVDHWTKDVEVLLTANPNYGGTKPALTSILIKNVPESSNQLTELQKGDADIAQNLTPEQLATLSGDAAAIKGDNLQLFYVGMNVAVEPLDKVEVREALRMAVDYDGIINDLLSGNGKKVQTIIPAGFFGFNDDAPFQQDVDGAKALLQKAGVSDVNLEMLVPEGAGPGGVAFADLAAKLQSDWAQIGVTVTLKQETIAELLNSYRAQKGQLVLIYWGPDFADPDTNVAPFTEFKLKSIAWRNSWDDPDIAAKAEAAALMTDQAEREAAYKEITEYVLHNGAYVILYQPSALFGIRSNVQGFAWSPIGYADLWSVSKTK